ncbi:MAG TPA: hypothetical protein VF521_05690, partial [Pyrinomonadaceae bacterium]
MAARRRTQKRQAQGQPDDAHLADRKIQPKLRMIANGSKLVNTLRAEHSAAVYVKDDKFLDRNRPKRGSDAVPLEVEQKKAGQKKVAPPPEGKGEEAQSGHRPPRDVFVNVFIERADASDKAAADGVKIDPKQFRITGQKANIATATVSLAALEKLARKPSVTYVEMGEALIDPKPRVDAPSSAAPRTRCPAQLEDLHGNGRGILIGIIDVQGFDFAHEDFLYRERGSKQMKTRFVRIWDQGGDPADQPKANKRPPFGYGVEYKQGDLNRALKDAPKVGVPPHMLAPQSQMFEGAHGTHVTSIAAGKSGFCPEADIAAVLISLPARKQKPIKKRRGGGGYDTEDADYRDTFYDSTRVVHALEYLLDLAKERGQPIAVNISLG